MVISPVRLSDQPVKRVIPPVKIKNQPVEMINLPIEKGVKKEAGKESTTKSFVGVQGACLAFFKRAPRFFLFLQKKIDFVTEFC
jgi:hypothetical protein